MKPPYWQDERVTLYGGDALAAPALATESHVVKLRPARTKRKMVRSDRMIDAASKYVNSDPGSGHEPCSVQRRQPRPAGIRLLQCVVAVRVPARNQAWWRVPAVHRLAAAAHHPPDALQACPGSGAASGAWVKPDARPQASRFTAQCEYVIRRLPHQC